MIMRRGNPGGPGKVRRRRPELEQTRRTAARLGQLVVELIRQEVLQRNRGAHADRGAHQCEQNDLRHEQPRPQATTSAANASASTAGFQRAGLRTYPAPRRVWIIGSRPLSIFLRRYETYNSTMLDRPPKS